MKTLKSSFDYQKITLKKLFIVALNKRILVFKRLSCILFQQKYCAQHLLETQFSKPLHPFLLNLRDVKTIVNMKTYENYSKYSDYFFLLF